MTGRPPVLKTPEQIEKLKALCKLPMSIIEIAKALGVTKDPVRFAIKEHGIIRHDLRKPFPKPYKTIEIDIPFDYKGYLDKAGFEPRLKGYAGGLFAVKKKPK